MRLRQTYSLGMRFEWRGEQELPGETNYLLGNDRSRWRTHVPHFARVNGTTSIPGVAIIVYGNSNGLEYDLRVAPGADRFKNCASTSPAHKVYAETPVVDLLLSTSRAPKLRMFRPSIYEESPSGARKPVKGDYLIERDGSIGFRIGAHSASSTLVIDPSLSVAYSTFLGGLGDDTANSIAHDSTGNIYIGGTTSSAASFPEGGAQALGPAGAGTDFFIAKINPSASGASSLVYLTFLGGSGNESGGLLAVDPTGDVAITGGTTSPDYPVTDSSLLASGPNSVAVSEINPAGNALLFSTLFGGNGQQSQFTDGGLALGPTGNIFVAADTSSTNLPVTAGAYQATLTGNLVDGFLAEFQPGASPGLIYCTYLGVGAESADGRRRGRCGRRRQRISRRIHVEFCRRALSGEKCLSVGERRGPLRCLPHEDIAARSGRFRPALCHSARR